MDEFDQILMDKFDQILQKQPDELDQIIKQRMDELDQIILAGYRPPEIMSGTSVHSSFTDATLTRNPNLSYLPNGTAVCDFGVESQDAESLPPIMHIQGIVMGEMYLCKAYGQTAEIISNYYRKGNQIDMTCYLWAQEYTRPAPNAVSEKMILYVEEITLSETRQICYDRGISTLCHFTPSERLSSILHRDFLSRSFLEKLPASVRPPFTDLDRDDGYKDAICLSISFPNYRMFFKKTNGKANQHKWVVLLLDVRILWENECAFCHQNARFEPVLRVPLEYRKTNVALERMFWPLDYHETGLRYLRQQIPENYPTHPEAEVLVFDTIPAEYINEVHFYDDTALQTWFKDNPETYSQKLYANRQYFKPRCDYKAWQNR